MMEKGKSSKSSERKTRTLTLTYLERDAASGDRKRDVERVLLDLRWSVDNTIPHVDSLALSCIAHWHTFQSHLRTNLKGQMFVQWFLTER